MYTPTLESTARATALVTGYCQELEAEMSAIYAMQRANGDWFALEQREGFRVPVFSSHNEAMQTRAFNVEMRVFKPVLNDERALKDLVPAASQRATHFWLVEDSCVNLKRGVTLQHSQLAGLIHGAAGQTAGTKA